MISTISQFYDAILNHVFDSVWVLDIDEGVITYISSMFSGELNHTNNSVLNQPANKFLNTESITYINNILPVRKRQFINDNVKEIFSDKLWLINISGDEVEVEAFSVLRVSAVSGRVEVVFASAIGRIGFAENLINQDYSLDYENIYNNTPVILHTIDTNERLISVNQSWLNITGYTREEVLFTESTNYLSENSRKSMRLVLDNFWKTGKYKNQEAQIVTKNGKIVDILASSAVEYNKAGRPKYAYTYIIDISEQKKEQKNLIEKKLKLNTILQNAEEAILVIQNKKIKYFNPRIIKISGYSAEDIQNEDFSKIIFPDDKSLVVANYFRRLNHENIENKYQFRIVTNTNQIKWLEISSVVIQWDEKPAVLAFLIEITQRKENEKEVENNIEKQGKLNKQLQKANKILEYQKKELIDYTDEMKAFIDEIAEKNKIIEEQRKILFDSLMEQEQLNMDLIESNSKLQTQKEELEDYNDEMKAYIEEIDKNQQVIETQKNELEDVHTDLTDSISYATHIQEALLPTSGFLDELFDNFVLYIPKDGVSGDFYFARQVNQYNIIAVADCTGHGVPGGLLTVLGINYLDEIIRNKDVNTPSKALTLLRQKVKGAFHKSKRKDGMDIALCAYNTEKNILEYSGANIPLLLVRDSKFHDFIPAKCPVGFHEREDEFTDHFISILPNDMIYLFSDGFQAQFGGHVSRKFQSRKFKQTLQKISSLPTYTQKAKLATIFNQWRGHNEQVDDVLVVGIKF